METTGGNSLILKRIVNWFKSVYSLIMKPSYPKPPTLSLKQYLMEVEQIIPLLETKEAIFFRDDMFVRDIMLSWKQICLYRYAFLGSMRVVFEKFLNELLNHYDKDGSIRNQLLAEAAQEKNNGEMEIKTWKIIKALERKLPPENKKKLDNIRLQLNGIVHYPFVDQFLKPVTLDTIEDCLKQLVSCLKFYLEQKKILVEKPDPPSSPSISNLSLFFMILSAVLLILLIYKFFLK